VAAGDSQVYGKFALAVLTGAGLDLDSETIKMALLDSGYTPDVDADEFWDDVSANEISATGYTAGGATLGSPATTYDAANNRAEYDAADPAWTLSTAASPAYAVMYDDTGTPGTSRLIAYWELAGTSVTGSYTLVVDAEGLFQARATTQTA
jgi:hypothetical protein